MEYLPILEELLTSNAVYFVPVGFIVAMYSGVKMDSIKKNILGLVGCLVVYGLCEFLCNRVTDNLITMILLFVGTLAISGVLGFLVVLIRTLLNR